MSCNCGSNCPPPINSKSSDCDCCPFPIDSGTAIVVKDDNCDDRLLDGEGLALRKDNQVFHTDGSEEKGSIPLNPAIVNGVDSFLVIVNGLLFQMGKDAPEGASIIRKGGQWVVTSLTAKNTVFNPSQLRTGAKQIAGFTCANDGLVNLGTIAPVSNTFLYWDEDGELTFVTPESLSTKLIIPLCSVVETIADTETVQGNLVCTENGIRKTSTLVTPTYWLDPKPLIYYQSKYAGVTPGSEGLAIPPLPSPTSGVFVSEDLDVDLTAFSGYTATATAVLLDCMAVLYNGSSNVWNMVLVVEGLERIRLSTNGAGSGASNGETQVMVPIPVNKKIRISAVRQTVTAGPNVEAATIAVRLTAFLSI